MEKPSTQFTRPIGVWILTIYAALFVGIVPLLLTILFGGSISELGLGVIFAIPFYIATFFCAFKTWQGDRRALYYFLILVTFNYVLVGINNLIYLLSNDVPTEESTRLLARVVRGVLFPAVFIGGILQYQRPVHRHAGRVGLVEGGIEIRDQAVAQ